MQCQCEKGNDKHHLERCTNEATETLLLPNGEIEVCAECADMLRQFLQYMVPEVPKEKTVLIVTDRPSVELQALANVVGGRLHALLRMAEEDAELRENQQN